MSKGEFAAHIGVSPGRVSQYIAEGQISGDAIEGAGRYAKIRAEVAKQQLRRFLDPSQRFGANGAAALSADAMPADRTAEPQAPPTERREPDRKQVSAPTLPPAPTDPTQDELAQLRLRRERIATEKAEREEMLEIGRYMLAEVARREMGRVAAEAFKVMEMGIGEMAKVMAAQFGIPQHDVQHALLKTFRSVRAKAAEDFRKRQADLPEHVEDDEDGAE
ncbi:hypothetical protein HV823_04275 [Rhizobium sp. DBTS2]|uniref:Terminase small subunit n=2 Tax=Mycoplana rhizolycopersici TaxID=2746702 RepID=A0ABX2Q9S6_9HYPH|nr:hypothetical protein [Rhizobium rhizolycopersici]